MELDEFERLISAAIISIPKRFRDLLENVAFVVEPSVRPARRQENPITSHGRLLGLYQGVPYGYRGPWYSGVLPDKITIFQAAIEAAAGADPNRIKQLVLEVVQHEIAHYFGMSEPEVRRWERGRKNRR